MALAATSAALVVIVVGVSISEPRPFTLASLGQATSSSRLSDVQLLDLPSVRRLFTSLAPQRGSSEEGERVAAWADVFLLAEAVAGAPVDPLAFDDLAAPTAASSPRVVATPGMTARDRVAYQLLGLGYSSRETADVVSGRISKRALDTARKMLLLGRGRDVAANYLDSQYKRVAASEKPSPLHPNDPRGMAARGFDAFIEKSARAHNVDAAVVRAIISVESTFDPRARSHAGAIGLMQLMPATARALGVDPWMPEQNIEGGVRYLSELLQMFGGIELALVAYNGGPGFARRYARGETALYGETRDYVKRVLARIR